MPPYTPAAVALGHTYAGSWRVWAGEGGWGKGRLLGLEGVRRKQEQECVTVSSLVALLLEASLAPKRERHFGVLD